MAAIDAGTVFALAALSLLTGEVVCTRSTEKDEIEHRARDMFDILGDDYEPVYQMDSLTPCFDVKQWPFDTPIEAFSVMEFDFAFLFQNKGHKDTETLPAETLKLLVDNPGIEAKYHLSRVKDSVIANALLPF